jgi:hypothetical protein
MVTWSAPDRQFKPRKERDMKAASITAVAVAASALLGAGPALAVDYGIYSGRGYNSAIAWRGPPEGPSLTWFLPRPRLGATFGTAANPAPIYGPALLFELGNGTPIYNAPGRLLSGRYRVVFP